MLNTMATRLRELLEIWWPSNETREQMLRTSGEWNGLVRLLLTSMARQAMEGPWMIQREDHLDRREVDWWVRKTKPNDVGREHWLWMVRLFFDRQGEPSHFEVFSASKFWDSMGAPRHGTFRAGLSKLELKKALDLAREDGPVHGLEFLKGYMPLWITL